jgi:hypothetical protein
VRTDTKIKRLIHRRRLSKKLVDAFAAYKVSKEQIEKRIQRRLDTITPAQLIQLRKIYNSLRDGMSGPADWFEAIIKPEDEKKGGNEKLKEKIKGKIDEHKPEPPPTKQCPDNGPVLTTACTLCPKREGCPAWE